MTLTIRNISEKAELNLKKIKNNNVLINTSTKAVEHALERHEYYKEYHDKYYEKLTELTQKRNQLNELKKAVQLLLNIEP